MAANAKTDDEMIKENEISRTHQSELQLNQMQELLKKKFADKKKNADENEKGLAGSDSTPSDPEPDKNEKPKSLEVTPTPAQPVTDAPNVRRSTVAANPIRKGRRTKSRNTGRHSKKHKASRNRSGSSSSSSTESDDEYGYGTSHTSQQNFGPMMHSMAFQAPYVAGFDQKHCCCCESSESSDDCLGGNDYDHVEDGVEFVYKPKQNGRTEFTVTVEPKKQPWLSMMKCGFKPMVNCVAPPAYLIPPNYNSPVPPPKNNCRCNSNQMNNPYQNPAWMQYNNCCNYNQCQPYYMHPGQVPSNMNANHFQHGHHHSHHQQSNQYSRSRSHNPTLGGKTAVVSKIEDVSQNSRSNSHSNVASSSS